jgi:hypothetical protein
MLARRYPRGFAFYLADPIISLHEFTARTLKQGLSQIVTVRLVKIRVIGVGPSPLQQLRVEINLRAGKHD